MFHLKQRLKFEEKKYLKIRITPFKTEVILHQQVNSVKHKNKLREKLQHASQRGLYMHSDERLTV